MANRNASDRVVGTAAAAMAVFWVAALADTVNRREWEVRTRRRRTWIKIVGFLPPIGPFLWLVVGRPRGPVPLPEQPMHPAQFFEAQRQLANDLTVLEGEDVTTR